MPTTIEWHEVARRLMLTLVAGTLLGINRWERGRAAGVRTTILVSLAGSLAMIQANLLLSTVWTNANTILRLDVMRLPLGILTGMGFIGGGVILRKSGMVMGVTTAATLWFATVVGLCFGGGQWQLGGAATALGLLVLWGFRWIEDSLPRESQGNLTLTVSPGSRIEDELPACFTGLNFHIVAWTVVHSTPEKRKLRCEIHWKPSGKQEGVPPFIARLAERSDIATLQWKERSAE
jgi:putative Mg2+ transporter-C (MgtC) family protein